MENGIMAKMKEVHQALKDYGVAIDALNKLDLESATELLNYKKAELREYVEEYDIVASSTESEQPYERSAN